MFRTVFFDTMEVENNFMLSDVFTLFPFRGLYSSDIESKNTLSIVIIVIARLNEYLL